MDLRWPGYAVVAITIVALVGYAAFASGAVAPFLGGYDATAADVEGADDLEEATGYEHVTVTAVDGETGEELGHVEAAVADTFSKRYVGLSETDELPADRGMLFVHDEPGEYTYVMRNMSFGIDIVFVAPNGTITTIHEAPEPGPDEDGASQEYSGQGQYVLEVNEGWMADHGVEEGDRLEVDR